jgi:hypothetical protein
LAVLKALYRKPNCVLSTFWTVEQPGCLARGSGANFYITFCTVS